MSIAAAVVTIGLKSGAWLLTGSVGLLSDAAESVVNLVAAIVALFMLRLAAKPADEEHNFGHTKAEFFSAAVEGGMIFIAALAIIVSSVERFLHPQPIENVGIGLLISVFASAINGGAAFVLLRAGRQYKSVTLRADGKHLMTDVWTSVGVLVGIALVALTGWQPLDPIVALAVGVNILTTGYRLLRGSVSGLLSATLPEHERAQIDTVLERYRTEHGVTFAPLRTVESGRQRFVFVVLTVPSEWTVKAAHDMTERLEADIDAILPGTETFVHVEPAEARAGQLQA